MNKAIIDEAAAVLKSVLTDEFGDGIELTMFGSAVRGTYDRESDIDILVLLPFEPTTNIEETIFGIAFDIELKYNIVFGLIVYSGRFWNSELAATMPLHRNIEREGARI
ncbi:MAG: hypothetical protein CVV44_21960 [Spirochaetae bacterium HGW-Spirochaetae-1]|jgi:predicted nucleotidyltransferase|nr:MAG: hypothetical protein CVV44_21960 [Spirochaetae bacterium HGW-Spirochaetae-1]